MNLFQTPLTLSNRVSLVFCVKVETTFILVVILYASSSSKCCTAQGSSVRVTLSFCVVSGCASWPLKPGLWHSALQVGEFAQPVVKMLSTGLFDRPDDYSTFNNLISKELSLEPFKESEIQLSLAECLWSVEDMTTESSLLSAGQWQVDVPRPKITM